MNEATSNNVRYDANIKIHIYDIEWLDVGTTSDYAPSTYDCIINANKNILSQIANIFETQFGMLPLAFKFSTVNDIKDIDYEKIKADYDDDL
jgi:hypothetical protein